MWTRQGKTDHRKKVHAAEATEGSGRGMLWWRGPAIPFQKVSGPQPGGQGRHGRGSSGLRRDRACVLERSHVLLSVQWRKGAGELRLLQVSRQEMRAAGTREAEGNGGGEGRFERGFGRKTSGTCWVVGK